MRAKNLILGPAAIVFAMGSAFTTRSLDFPPNARVWWKQTATSSFICTALPVECSDQIDGPFCTAAIMKADGSMETVSLYKNVLCTILLKCTPESCSSSYDAGPGNRPFDVANTSSGN